MLNQLLSLGLQSLAEQGAMALRPPRRADARHPLSAYPKLQEIMARAEKSGALAAQRRALAERRFLG